MHRSIESAAACALVAAVLACASDPPRDPDDICAIFAERRSWHRSSVRSFQRWGVPESLQLAIIFQESSFRSDARPQRRRFLWVIPGPRPSSAFGYGQVLDETWATYRNSTGRRGADRDDFDDVVDFIGWYANTIQRRTGLSRHDAYGLYLAYHEGPGGFQRGTHNGKAWLRAAARQVEDREQRYRMQYAACGPRLGSVWGFWRS